MIKRLIHRIRFWKHFRKPKSESGRCSFCEEEMGRPTFFKGAEGLYWKYMCEGCINLWRQRSQDLRRHLKEFVESSKE